MSTIKNENFIAIQGWMVNELKLKGNALMIYAIIYGFSQIEGHTFNGSLQYLADWTNSTKQGVIKAIKKLIDDELIAKKEKYINNVKFVEYHVTKFNEPLNKVERGIKQSLPNNIDNNIEHNITIPKGIEKTPKTYGNEDINLLFEKWEEICDYPIKTKIKANRFACNRLIKAHGLDNVLAALPIIAESHTDKYAPSVCNFMDLAEKWDKIGVWYKKKKTTDFMKHGTITVGI